MALSQAQPTQPAQLPSPSKAPDVKEEKNRLPDPNEALAILKVALKLRGIPDEGKKEDLIRYTADTENYENLIKLMMEIGQDKTVKKDGRTFTLADWEAILLKIHDYILAEDPKIQAKQASTLRTIGKTFQAGIGWMANLVTGSNKETIDDVFINTMIAVYNYCRIELQKSFEVQQLAAKLLVDLEAIEKKYRRLCVNPDTKQETFASVEQEYKQLTTRLVNLGSDEAVSILVTSDIHEAQKFAQKFYGHGLMQDRHYRWNSMFPLFCNKEFFKYYFTEFIAKADPRKDERDVESFKANAHDDTVRKTTPPRWEGIVLTAAKGTPSNQGSPDASSGGQPGSDLPSGQPKPGVQPKPATGTPAQPAEGQSVSGLPSEQPKTEVRHKPGTATPAQPADGQPVSDLPNGRVTPRERPKQTEQNGSPKTSASAGQPKPKGSPPTLPLSGTGAATILQSLNANPAEGKPAVTASDAKAATAANGSTGNNAQQPKQEKPKMSKGQRKRERAKRKASLAAQSLLGSQQQQPQPSPDNSGSDVEEGDELNASTASLTKTGSR